MQREMVPRSSAVCAVHRSLLPIWWCRLIDPSTSTIRDKMEIRMIGHRYVRKRRSVPINQSTTDEPRDARGTATDKLSLRPRSSEAEIQTKQNENGYRWAVVKSNGACKRQTTSKTKQNTEVQSTSNGDETAAAAAPASAQNLLLIV